MRASGMITFERHHLGEISVGDFADRHASSVIAQGGDVAALVFALDFTRPGFCIDLQIKGAAD